MKLIQIRRTLLYKPVSTEFYFHQTIPAIPKVNNRITLKAVAVAVMEHVAVKSLRIDPQVSDAQRLENKTECGKSPQQILRTYPQDSCSNRGIGKISCGGSAYGGL